MTTTRRPALLAACCLVAASTLACQGPKDTARPELGRVMWQREFDLALRNNKDQRPLFALFQEVPG